MSLSYAARDFAHSLEQRLDVEGLAQQPAGAEFARGAQIVDPFARR
jgi:hypothetical protein